MICCKGVRMIASRIIRSMMNARARFQMGTLRFVLRSFAISVFFRRILFFPLNNVFKLLVAKNHYD